LVTGYIIGYIIKKTEEKRYVVRYRIRYSFWNEEILKNKTHSHLKWDTIIQEEK
jgi:hypothetical protein